MRYIIIRFCCSLLLVSLNFWAGAQDKAAVIKAPSGRQYAVLQKRLTAIDGLLAEYVKNRWIAGGTALVIKDGKVVYHKSLGTKDLETMEPLRNDAIYRIASQTKAITSVGVMILMEEGKLQLDEAVSKYIPEFKNTPVLQNFNAGDTTYTTVPAKREITIRDLLTHTSGIGYAQIGNAQMNAIYYKAGIVGGIGVDNLVLGDKMKLLGSLPLFHQPGERFTYGLNTDLLGYLIEVISGINLDQFFRQRIFEPLGMRDTYFYLPPSKHSRLVALHTEDDAQNKKLVKAIGVQKLNGNFYPDYPNLKGTYFSGGGGLSSTAYDYGVFMQMLLNGGSYKGKRIISPATVRMMTTNQIGSLSIGGGNKFGLGFEIVQPNNSKPLSPGSYLWGGMFSSSYWIDPKEKMVVQLFLNQYPMSHGEIHNKFRSVVYAALK
ncbi:MAG TPA: serine hydrolase domain-containing protein [Chitinophagaceae bacterium]|nr:serine hydrolase domain-containing protein [Chitinophagaceae bacterium]